METNQYLNLFRSLKLICFQEAPGVVKFLLEAVWPACHARHERAGWITARYEKTIADWF